MVSAEGACAAYYAYGRHLEKRTRTGRMIAPPTAPVDKLVESFREKILRKCGESIEMKERFFTKYAEPLEAMSRALAVRFEKGGDFSRWKWRKLM